MFQKELSCVSKVQNTFPLPLMQPSLPPLFSSVTQMSCSSREVVGIFGVVNAICRVPVGAKDVKALGEDVVVHETSVDGEGPHQDNDVAALEDGGEYLQ